MIYFKIGIIAAVLYISLRVLRIALSAFLPGERSKDIYLKAFPLAELALWSALFFWALHQLLGEARIYPFVTAIIVIVLILVTGWYFLRDVVAGVILRADSVFRIGQEIKTPSLSGSISRIGWRSLLVITDDGEEIIVPYSQLINDRISLNTTNGKPAGYVANLKIPANQSPEYISSFLHKSMIETPWIVSPEKIKIRIQREEGYFLAEIRYHATGPEMAIKTEENLNREIEKLDSKADPASLS